MENKFEQYNNRKISEKVCEVHRVNYWQISTPKRGSRDRIIQSFALEVGKGKLVSQEKEEVKTTQTVEINLKT